MTIAKITITGDVLIGKEALAKCFADACKQFGMKPVKGFKINEAFIKEFSDDIINAALSMGITDFFQEGINADLYRDFIADD